jgi:hypothetical protein
VSLEWGGEETVAAGVALMWRHNRHKKSLLFFE